MKKQIAWHILNSKLYPALVLALLGSLALAAWPLARGNASTNIPVTTFEDKINTDGFCSLREAVISANKDKASSSSPGECPAGSGADTISLPAGTYTLTRTDNGREDATSTGDLDIAGDLTFEPSGPVTINTISGFKDRVFHVLSGNVTLNSLTISGGIANGDGGGILNLGQLIILQTTLSANRAGGQGGGIYNNGTLTLRNSTLSGNAAKTNGGAIFNFGGTANLNNVTVTLNTSDSDANGTGNGGGISRSGGSVEFKNTLLAGNSDLSASTKDPDCSGTLTSQGYNLVQTVSAGCTISGDTTGNLTGADPLLGPLAPNGGNTPTHALPEDSPAVDAANPAPPGSGGAACEASDQRGIARPQRTACDMGAFELEGEGDPAQTGPTYLVNTPEDVDDGVCSVAHCSLREAVNAANARTNDTPLDPDKIHFSLPGSAPFTLSVSSALPEISDPLVIDGTPEAGGLIILDGAGAGAGVDGLVISGGGSTIKGLTIQNFSANGIRLLTNGGNTVSGNTISLNGAAGVAIESSSGNTIANNTISDNGGLGIDLGAPGPEANDPTDGDSGANGLQNYPVLLQATPSNGTINIIGRLNSAPTTAYSLEFYANSICDASNFGEGPTFLGRLDVTTDDKGNVVDEKGNITFLVSFQAAVAEGEFVVATATDPAGSTSEFSQCVSVGPNNNSWVNASRLTLVEELNEERVDRYLDKAGQARWFKFKVTPGSKVIVTLTSLPANYDLTLYKDIGQAFKDLNTTEDLVRLSAEFAPDSFAPDSFAPDSFAADAFSPDSFAPDSFAPDSFAPDSFAPDSFAPDSFAPDSFAPDSFAPDSFAPDSFAPDSFAPDSFAPDSFAPDSFAPDSFASAQTRSLIAVSAFEGTAGEGIRVNTWENTGFFYIRVRGRNGVFNLQDSFHLEVFQLPGICAQVNPDLPDNSLQASAGGFKTLILTDLDRMGVPRPEQRAMLLGLLNQLKDRPEVVGEIVDVGTDERVSAANAQADAYPGCPFATNLAAYSIKKIVDAYAALNPMLEYVVIVGNDHVIPFFRHPDHAMLANEKNYVPPVKDDTASQASLKLGYVLSQDDYGAGFAVSVKDDFFPVPGLAVGRLVETPDDVMGMLNAYLHPDPGTLNGGVLTPTSALITGYDFLADAAGQVQAELEAGLGAGAEALIDPREQSPMHAEAWTADDLRTALLGSRHDLIFLAGHFSASSALAADYTTRLSTAELVDANLANALVFSPGCHAGYNIVNPHGIEGVTGEPDWAQAFASQGATLIAGTGYQYGDTDFIEYSERLYLEFSRQLRTGNGPVSVGKALVAAKQAYLGGTPQLRGIHEKALLEATLFGLPMLAVDMPGERLTPPGEGSIVGGTTGYLADPGLTLGLEYADVNFQPGPTLQTKTLTDVTTSGDPMPATVEASYLLGPDGVVANPSEPILPLEIANVTVPGMVLRGVGLRSGSYVDMPDRPELPGLLPLLGAATTELRGVHTPFLTNVFYPVRFWHPNYFDALGNAGGKTRLSITPAQYISRSPGDSYGIFRRYDNLDFRLFYSANTETYCPDNTPPPDCIPSIPSLSGSPTISHVKATPDNGNVHFRIQVVGNPAAGIQEVWVTYSGVSGPFYGQWQSLDLQQNSDDSTLWEGTLALGAMNAQDVRYMVQAVNGVGLVTQVTNLGAYYIPGVDSQPTLPTALALSAGGASGAYGTEATFSAVLTSNGSPLANQLVSFALGPQNRRAVTDGTGRATVNMLLLGLPGTNTVRASFAGTAEYLVSSTEINFDIEKQDTLLTLEPDPDPDPISIQYSDGVVTVATLTDLSGRCPEYPQDCRRLGDQTVFFVVRGANGTFTQPVITDYAGRASLLTVPLSLGSYTIDGYFSGIIPLPDLTLELEDERYNPSSDSASLNLQAEDATVTYTGPARAAPGASLTLSGQATQAEDGFPGDISLAQVQFDIRDGANTVIATQTAQVGPDGSVSAIFADGLAPGSYQVELTVVGGYFTSPTASAALVVDSPPVCSLAAASPDRAWPPNFDFVAISVVGVTDPDGDAITITIDSIFQDEPVGSGEHSPDGQGIGSNTAEVRAERNQNDNGRVYHIDFTASDPSGGACSGEVLVGVPPDQGGEVEPIDDGRLYDSTVPD